MISSFSKLLSIAKAEAPKAVSYTHRVQRRELHAEVKPFKALSVGLYGCKALGRVFLLLVGDQERTNARVRAYERALVALDAIFAVPAGQVYGLSLIHI